MNTGPLKHVYAYDQKQDIGGWALNMFHIINRRHISLGLGDVSEGCGVREVNRTFWLTAVLSEPFQVHFRSSKPKLYNA